MKMRIAIAALVVAGTVALVRYPSATGATGAAEPSATRYVLDADHTSVVFRISHMGMSFTYGRFNRVEGSFEFDSADPNGSSFAVGIRTASIDTNNKKRDSHLKSPEFFNADQFPAISFKSTDVHAHGPKINVTGEMTMHGVTKPIEFHMLKVGEGKDPWGKIRIGFATQFRIKRSDYGMKHMLNVVGDDVELFVSFEGIKKIDPRPAAGPAE